MDHATAVRRLYDLINAGDIDGLATNSPTTSLSAKTYRASLRPGPASSNTFRCCSQRSRTYAWFRKT